MVGATIGTTMDTGAENMEGAITAEAMAAGRGLAKSSIDHRRLLETYVKSQKQLCL